jgi:tripartite motif-containing protein 9/67
MDFELRCPSCKEYYQSPIYLPCFHSLCYICALTSIRSITNITEQNNSSFSSDLDKLSLKSDNDSGISSSSLLLLPALPKISFLSHEKSYLQCPTCLKIIYIDKSDVKSLPKNHLLSDIINHYHPSITHTSIDESQEIFCQNHLNQLANFYCLHCRLECCQQCSKHNNHEIISLHQAVKIYKVNFYY